MTRSRPCTPGPPASGPAPCQQTGKARIQHAAPLRPFRATCPPRLRPGMVNLPPETLCHPRIAREAPGAPRMSQDLPKASIACELPKRRRKDVGDPAGHACLELLQNRDVGGSEIFVHLLPLVTPELVMMAGLFLGGSRRRGKGWARDTYIMVGSGRYIPRLVLACEVCIPEAIFIAFCKGLVLISLTISSFLGFLARPTVHHRACRKSSRQDLLPISLQKKLPSTPFPAAHDAVSVLAVPSF